jgi:ribonucleotide monophosphatase NagD (HAD superfamily)
MNEAQAITLAEKHADCTFDAKRRQTYSFDSYGLAAMLTDYRAQVIAELAQQTGVMPPIIWDGFNWCDPELVKKAIAIMQAKLEQAQADAARLDFIETQQDFQWQTHQGQWRGGNGSMCRDMIDAAMKEQG